MKPVIISLFLFVVLFSCKNNQQPAAEQKKVMPPPVHTDSVTACVLSQIAYCNRPQQLLDSFLPGWTVIWNPAPINGNYAFAARNHNTIAVAIRGSVMEFSEAAFQNWVYQDLNAARQTAWTYTDSATNAKVSAGAYEGWENLTRLKDTATSKSLWMVLREQQNSNPVLVTGHSLGGNLATVYASWLKWNFRETKTPAPEINIITFAAPAAGNKAFAEAVNQMFPLARRFENTNDMVPKFPSVKSIKELGGLFAGGPSASDI
ncbi:MAG: lipase family protein, partial [Dinghuibacter sp.]|nr:lipase family protein [Dinghuibacter sp.]